MPNVTNLQGMRFGRLVVVSRVGVTSYGQATWECLCDCGATKVAANGSLKSGGTSSCGCLSREKKAERVAGYRQKHGHAHLGKMSSTYMTWRAMISRCTNPKAENFKYYGALGVRVCDRWLNSFSDFLADMGERPAGLTLDREDPTGNYEPNNCRWATRLEQAHNKRASKAKGGFWEITEVSA